MVEADRTRRIRSALDERWLWLVPPAVLVVAWISAGALATVAAFGIGLFFVGGVLLRPRAAVVALVIVIVFNLALLSLAYKVGMPVDVVKAMSFWKEGVVAGSAVAVLRQPHRRPIDLLDGAALLYVAIGTVYLAVPSSLLNHGSGSGLSLYDRALDWRNDVLYVLAFVTCRRLRFSRQEVDRLLDRFLVVAAVLAAIGVFEEIASGLFNHLAVTDLGVTRYEQHVVGYKPGPSFNVGDIRTYTAVGGHLSLRIGSILFDYLAIGFVFAIGLGIAADRIARGRARWPVYVALPLLLAGLALTQTRSALIAGGLAVAMGLRTGAGTTLRGRLRLARFIAVLILVATPVVTLSGTFARFIDSPASNSAHRSGLDTAITTLASHPLGRGLGTSAGGAQLLLGNQGGTVILTEDQYLQIGVQLGLLGMACYVVVVVLVLRKLLRSRRRATSPPAAAMANGALGVFAGLLFTQALVNIELALALWILLGLAVGVVDQDEARDCETDQRAGIHELQEEPETAVPAVR